MQEAQAQVGMGRYLAAIQDFNRVPQGAPQYSMAREDATLAQRDSALYRTGKVASSINAKFDNDMQAFWNDYNAAIKDTNRSWDNWLRQNERGPVSGHWPSKRVPARAAAAK